MWMHRETGPLWGVGILVTLVVATFSTVRSANGNPDVPAIFQEDMTETVSDVESVPEPVKPIRKLRSILVVGDSHSTGYFGRKLHKSLRKAFPKARVYLYGVCGVGERRLLKGGRSHCGVMTINNRGRSRIVKGCRSNPCTEEDGPDCKKDACRFPSLKAMFSRTRPDLVVFQTGGNSWKEGTPRNGWGSVERKVERIHKMLARRKALCVWVTPTDHLDRSIEGEDMFSDMYERVNEGKCAVFNSRPSHHPYMSYRDLIKDEKLKHMKNDGVHYGWFRAHGRKIQGMWVRDVVKLTKSHWYAHYLEE